MANYAIVRVLQTAKAKIEDPARWCTDDYAQSAGGAKLAPYSPLACRFCALGAVESCFSEHDYDRTCSWTRRLLADAAAAVAQDLGVEIPPTKARVPFINDHCGHAAVMEMYERAIQLAKGEAA